MSSTREEKKNKNEFRIEFKRSFEGRELTERSKRQSLRNSGNWSRISSAAKCLINSQSFFPTREWIIHRQWQWFISFSVPKQKYLFYV